MSDTLTIDTAPQVEAFLRERLLEFYAATDAEHASIQVQYSIHRYGGDPRADDCHHFPEWSIYHSATGWTRGDTLGAAWSKAITDSTEEGLLKIAADMEAHARHLRERVAKAAKCPHSPTLTPIDQ